MPLKSTFVPILSNYNLWLPKVDVVINLVLGHSREEFLKNEK